MTATDRPASARYDSTIEWEQSRGVRRILAAARSVVSGLVDGGPAGYAAAAVVVRERQGARAEVTRIASDAHGVGALAQQVERDLDRLTEEEFLREWGDADPSAPR